MNVLIIGNNCISKSGAAGRTIAGCFDNNYDYKLAQFYIWNEKPDYDLYCQNFFRITDREMLTSFLPWKKVGKVMVKDDIEPTKTPFLDIKQGKIIKKTVFTYILRNLIWKFGRWKSVKFMNWLDDFSPDVIFFYNTDSKFLIDIAIKIAKKRDIPVVIFNTENYYFNEKCHLYQSKISKILYPLWLKSYRKSFKKLILYAGTTIHNSLDLRDKYSKEFGKSGIYVYNPTDILPRKKYNVSNPPTFAYMGNLGLNRYKSLIEIGDTLKKIDDRIRLDVFGNANHPMIIDTLNNTPSINYKGVISYEEVVENMYNYDFLVHAESFESEFIESIQYGFSTKIVDCLASGTCTIVYAHSSLLFIKHLLRENAACVILEPDSLERDLRSIISDEERRKTYVDNAIHVAQTKHNKKINNEIFFSAISDTITNFQKAKDKG